MINVLLFDLGGVLVELSGVPTMLKWTDNRYDVEMLWDAWLSSPAVRAFETGNSTAEEFATRIVGEMQLPVSADEFIQRFRAWPKGLYPGVTKLLDRLRTDYTLACFSNSNDLHWPILMDDMGMAALFEYRFASHLMGRVKPDKEAFQYVLEGLNCDPASVLFLDDNGINVRSATEVGMRAHRARGPLEIEQVLLDTRILKPAAS